MHYLLFTGQMIDKPGVKEPRFPVQKERLAKNAIRKTVLEEKNKAGAATLMAGIAGGACGGDILFHEACMYLGLPTHIYLALPPAQFVNESVAFAGTAWVERFYKLIDKLPYSVLPPDIDMPGMSNKRPKGNIWSEANSWMLNNAMVGNNMTLIVLGDGEGSGGAYCTEDMFNKAKEKCARTVIISINNL